MALINCKECKKEVSNKAKTCPHCGVKNPAITVKDYLIGFAGLIVIIFLLSLCSFDDKPVEKVALNDQQFNIVTPEDATEEVKEIVSSNIEKIKQICPGLDKYADSLTFEKIKDNFDFAPSDAQRVSITFWVADDGGNTPKEYGAMRNRCFLEVSRDGTQLVIPKRACQSICLDQDMTKSKFSDLILSLETGKILNKAWYEGGNLHSSNALEWQKASYANKLATCGDLLAVLYKNQKLANSITIKIKTVDDFEPLARLLLTQMDDAFLPAGNAKENANMFANQKVSETAILIMTMAGWIEV